MERVDFIWVEMHNFGLISKFKLISNRFTINQLAQSLGLTDESFRLKRLFAHAY